MISRVSFFIALGSILYPVTQFDSDPPWPELTLSLLIALITIPLFLDFRGVMIDLSQNRIRTYRSYWGIRYGTWIPLHHFDKMCLTWERITYRSSVAGTVPAVSVGFAVAPAPKKSSDSYIVNLLSSKGVPPIELGDLISHRAARKFLFKYSKLLSVPIEDKYQKRKEAAARRRAEVEARRYS